METVDPDRHRSELPSVNGSFLVPERSCRSVVVRPVLSPSNTHHQHDHNRTQKLYN